MAIALLTIAICLLLSAALPELAQLRSFAWYQRWLSWLHQRFSINGFWSGWMGWALAVLPWTLLLWALSWLLNGALFGLLSFALSLLVVFFCLGPRDLSEDVTELAHAHTAEQRLQAQRAFGIEAPLALSTNALIQPLFEAALRRQFAVIFCFLLAGPAGALGYRLSERLAQTDDPDLALPEGLRDCARRAHDALAWLPAQLMCLALALSSDFDAVSRAWHEHHDKKGSGHWFGLLNLDLSFLSSTAKACVDLDDVDDIDDPLTRVDSEALLHAQQLMGRITLAWLMALAMIVLTIYLS